jgi:hypothetical protein
MPLHMHVLDQDDFIGAALAQQSPQRVGDLPLYGFAAKN